MPQDPRTDISCPVGAEECPTLVEVQRLQEECQSLERQLQIDHLTHLFNVRHFFSALEHEMERTRRTGLPTALIMIDLDHFKQINDNFGHQTGNQVLKWVSKLWRETLRRIDIACRYGGEEFAVILPATRLTNAVRAAERLRAIVQSSSLEINDRTIRITASFGVDTYALREEVPVDAFVHRVDQLLLEAKATGRNRVCHQTAEARPVPTEISTEERAMLFVGRWPKG